MKNGREILSLSVIGWHVCQKSVGWELVLKSFLKQQHIKGSIWCNKIYKCMLLLSKK